MANSYMFNFSSLLAKKTSSLLLKFSCIIGIMTEPAPRPPLDYRFILLVGGHLLAVGVMYGSITTTLSHTAVLTSETKNSVKDISSKLESLVESQAFTKASVVGINDRINKLEREREASQRR